MVTQAIVTSVAVDERSGRVRGVSYLKGGEEYFQPADVVLLAGYTYENVRMLLLSKSKPFPNGLANNGGQVGRHYMTHHTAATVTALFPSTSTTGTACPRRASPSTTGPTTTSTISASTSSAAAISGSIPTAARSRPRS